MQGGPDKQAQIDVVVQEYQSKLKEFAERIFPNQQNLIQQCLEQDYAGMHLFLYKHFNNNDKLDEFKGFYGKASKDIKQLGISPQDVSDVLSKPQQLPAPSNTPSPNRQRQTPQPAPAARNVNPPRMQGDISKPLSNDEVKDLFLMNLNEGRNPKIDNLDHAFQIENGVIGAYQFANIINRDPGTYEINDGLNELANDGLLIREVIETDAYNPGIHIRDENGQKMACWRDENGNLKEVELSQDQIKLLEEAEKENWENQQNLTKENQFKNQKAFAKAIGFVSSDNAEIKGVNRDNIYAKIEQGYKSGIINALTSPDGKDAITIKVAVLIYHGGHFTSAVAEIKLDAEKMKALKELYQKELNEANQNGLKTNDPKQMDAFNKRFVEKHAQNLAQANHLEIQHRDPLSPQGQAKHYSMENLNRQLEANGNYKALKDRQPKVEVKVTPQKCKQQQGQCCGDHAAYYLAEGLKGKIDPDPNKHPESNELRNKAARKVSRLQQNAPLTPHQQRIQNIDVTKTQNIVQLNKAIDENKPEEVEALTKTIREVDSQRKQAEEAEKAVQARNVPAISGKGIAFEDVRAYFRQADSNISNKKIPSTGPIEFDLHYGKSPDDKIAVKVEEKPNGFKMGFNISKLNAEGIHRANTNKVYDAMAEHAVQLAIADAKKNPNGPPLRFKVNGLEKDKRIAMEKAIERALEKHKTEFNDKNRPRVGEDTPTIEQTRSQTQREHQAVTSTNPANANQTGGAGATLTQRAAATPTPTPPQWGGTAQRQQAANAKQSAAETAVNEAKSKLKSEIDKIAPKPPEGTEESPIRKAAKDFRTTPTDEHKLKLVQLVPEAENRSQVERVATEYQAAHQAHDAAKAEVNKMNEIKEKEKAVDELKQKQQEALAAMNDAKEALKNALPESGEQFSQEDQGKREQLDKAISEYVSAKTDEAKQNAKSDMVDALGGGSLSEASKANIEKFEEVVKAHEEAADNLQVAEVELISLKEPILQREAEERQPLVVEFKQPAPAPVAAAGIRVVQSQSPPTDFSNIQNAQKVAVAVELSSTQRPRRSSLDSLGNSFASAKEHLNPGRAQTTDDIPSSKLSDEAQLHLSAGLLFGGEKAKAKEPILQVKAEAAVVKAVDYVGEGVIREMVPVDDFISKGAGTQQNPILIDMDGVDKDDKKAVLKDILDDLRKAAEAANGPAIHFKIKGKDETYTLQRDKVQNEKEVDGAIKKVEAKHVRFRS